MKINTDKRLRTVLIYFLLLMVLAGFCLTLTMYWEPAIMTPDANGYWAGGSLIAETGKAWFRAESDTQYIGIHWLMGPEGRYFCRYPPGLSMFIAGFYSLGGYKSSILVNPILALLSLVGLFFLIKVSLGHWWALIGTAFMAFNPLFIQQSIWCFAHIAVTFLLIWGAYLLFRWQENKKPLVLFSSALFFGIIPTVRYPEGIFILSFILFYLINIKGLKKWWLHLVAGTAGILLPIIPLLIRNHHAFGKFYLTGYSLTQEQTGFSLSNIKSNLVVYLKSFNTVGLGFFFAVGIAGLIGMILLKKTRQNGIFLAFLTISSLVLYNLYYWSSPGQDVATLRFFLPVFFCFIVAAIWILSYLSVKKSKVLKAMALVLIVFQLVWTVFIFIDLDKGLKDLKYKKSVLVTVTNSLEENVKEDSVIIAHPDILQHLDFVRKWRLAEIITRPVPEKAGPVPGSGYDEASPMQEEKMELRIEKYEGLLPAEIESLLAEDILDWADGSKVFFLLTEEQLTSLRGKIFNKGSLKVVKRIKLPEDPLSISRGFRPQDKADNIPQGDLDLFWRSIRLKKVIFLLSWQHQSLKN